MNLVFTKGVCNVFPSVNSLQFVPVRYRYYAEKIAKGPLIKNFGYKDKLFKEGLLPRLKDAAPLRTPLYRPSNPWSSEKARFGQNDYIDILGGGKVRPPDIAYEVPRWLRGRRGNEMQLLILKQKVFSNTDYEYQNPTRWSNIGRRITYLYRYLNRKTKTNFSKKQ